MINWIYLHKNLLNLEIKIIITSLLIKNINNKIININKYIIIIIYIRNTFNRQSKTIYFIIKIYIIDDLKANIFININILILEGIIIDLNIKILIFNKYSKLQILFDIIIKLNPYFKRIIRFKSVIIITPDTTIKIFIIYNNNILYNKDFLFELNYI